MRYLSLSLLALLLIPLIGLQEADAADWYNSNWFNARKITVDQTDIDSDLTNYPLYVNMTSVNIGTDSQADCDDFVFTDSTNVTKLDHEIETCSDANNWGEFWVEIPTVTGASDTVIFMYYNNTGATDQQNTQGTWNSDYMAVWHLNGTFIDSTSSPVTCSNTGTSALTDAYLGDSRSYDGVDDILNCGSDSKIDNIYADGGSFSVWIDPDNDGENNAGRIYDKQNTLGPIFFLSGEVGTNMQYSLLITFTGTDGQWITTGLEIQENVWNLLTVTYDGSATANNPIFYVDGASVAITETSTPTLAIDTDAGSTMYVGNRAATDRTFDGDFDDLRLVDEVLSAAWVKADWECQKGGTLSSEGPEFSCITVGAQGTEPAAGGSHSQTYDESATITDTLVFTGTGSQAYSESATITDTLVFTSTGMQDYLEDATITDDLVFIYNDLNPDFIENMTLSDDYSHLCAGTCGVTPTNNAIVISLAPRPMAEVSYFSTTGTAIIITGISDGSTNLVAVNPTTTFTPHHMFDNGGADDGVLRYIGNKPNSFHVAASISFSGVGANDDFVYAVAVNGVAVPASKIVNNVGTPGDLQSTAIHVMVTLNPNDELSLLVGNLDSTADGTIKTINLFAMGMP